VVPGPSALAASEVDGAIDRALDEARERGVHGKALTPHLLAELRGATAGRSLEANVALVLENARVATEVARALCA
jgi:pseudouridine-5'-phosphate glycosidase